MSFFGDILKEPTEGGRRFSQGRIYLFISFSAFITLNILLSVCAFIGVNLESKETLELVSSNLKWALGSFSLYVLGGKGIGAFRDRDTGISNNYNHERKGGNNPYGGHVGNSHSHSNTHSDFGPSSYGGAYPPSDVDGDDEEHSQNESNNNSSGGYGADEEEIN